MRFVTLKPSDVINDRHAVGPALDRVGVVAESGVHILRGVSRLVDLLGDDGERLHRAGEQALADPLEVIVWTPELVRAPIPLPPTMRDFMVFEQHVEGAAKLMGDGTIGAEWYEMPVFYFTNPYAICGPYDDVPMPPGCQRFDYELEVAAVVGRAGRDLTPEQGEQRIVGYTIVNDWSARDIQAREMQAHLGPAKGKDTTTTLGPTLVTVDELAPYRNGDRFDLGMEVSVNGVLMGSDRLNNMAWTFGEMVAYASRGTWVHPGDVLGSGTCGNGCLAELWGRHGRDVAPALALGDVVTLSVEGLGQVSNRIVRGAEPVPLVPRVPGLVRSHTGA